MGRPLERRALIIDLVSCRRQPRRRQPLPRPAVILVVGAGLARLGDAGRAERLPQGALGACIERSRAPRDHDAACKVAPSRLEADDLHWPQPTSHRDGGAAQHSMMFTARPPRAVSLYLVLMSAPVRHMVLMTLSSETLWVPSP